MTRGWPVDGVVMRQAAILQVWSEEGSWGGLASAVPAALRCLRACGTSTSDEDLGNLPSRLAETGQVNERTHLSRNADPLLQHNPGAGHDRDDRRASRGDRPL